MAHPAIETDAWHLGGKALLAFYAVEVKDEGSSTPRDVVDGVAWLPTGTRAPNRDAPSEHSPFQTAAEVRRGLRSLGFK